MTLWTVACQAPLSAEFSRQERWSGLPCPPPGEDPGVELASLKSPALAGEFLSLQPSFKLVCMQITKSCFPERGFWWPTGKRELVRGQKVMFQVGMQ